MDPMARKIEFAQGAGGTGTRGLSDEAYKTGYNAGWHSSKRFASSGPKWSSALERADVRGMNDAYYDGYHDEAAGRAKWHMPNCSAHHNGPGGCGEA